MLTVQLADTLRDFEFIHGNRWNTHFVKDIAASRLDDGRGSRLQAALICDLGLKAPASHQSFFKDSDLLGSFNPNLMQHATLIGESLGTGRAHAMAREERRVQFRMTLKRFAFAIIGGLIIVVPMLILVVGSATVKTLAVISTSIFLFALGVAVFSPTEPGNLLAATAAYAAVLMALIGGGGGSNL
jgi:VIT1/CCC1 family predicted Fe2+/Mn2+ transporter